MSPKDANWSNRHHYDHSRRHVHYSIGDLVLIQGLSENRAIASEASSLFPAYEGPYRVSGFKRNRVLELSDPLSGVYRLTRMCRPSRNIFREPLIVTSGLRISSDAPSPLATKDQPAVRGLGKKRGRLKRLIRFEQPHRVALVRHLWTVLRQLAYKLDARSAWPTASLPIPRPTRRRKLRKNHANVMPSPCGLKWYAFLVNTLFQEVWS